MLDPADFPPLPSPAREKKKRRNPNKQPEVPFQGNGPTKVSLETLPVELLLQILDNFMPHSHLEAFERRALLSLSSTNRRFHSLVSKRLYALFSDGDIPAKNDNPYQFLRTILNNSNLAANVRALWVGYESFDGYEIDASIEERIAHHSPSILDKQSIKNGLKELRIPGWKEWAMQCNDDRALEYGRREILYAAILLCTPNIEALKIIDGSSTLTAPKWTDLIRWTVNGNRRGQMHSFTHLKSIFVRVGSLRLCDLAPVFKLPSLRELCLAGLAEPAPGKEGKADSLTRLLPPRSSLVESLDLLSSCIHIDVLSVVLAAIRTLKKFSYENNDDSLYRHIDTSSYEFHSPWDGLRGKMANFDILTEFLRAHHHSLEQLRLTDAVVRVLRSTRPERPPEPLGSLQEFEALVHLGVPMRALEHGERILIAQDIPGNLQVLQLAAEAHHIGTADSPGTMAYAVKDIAYRADRLFPSLQAVHILYKGYRLQRGRLVHWKKIDTLFRDQGIRFDMTHLEPDITNLESDMTYLEPCGPDRRWNLLAEQSEKDEENGRYTPIPYADESDDDLGHSE